MNERLGPTAGQLHDAEQYRYTGNPAIAADMMRPYVFTAPEFAWEMDHDTRMRTLEAARIFTVSELTSARRSWRARSVAEHLTQARVAIAGTYRHPAFREAYRTRQPEDNDPYSTYLETVRDEADYAFTLASLTGNMGFFRDAVRRLDEAAAGRNVLATRAAASFDAARMRFKTAPSRDAFDREDKAFRQAVAVAEVSGMWERAATIGSRYTMDALAHGSVGQILDGLGVVTRAAVYDPSTIGIFPRVWIRDATDAVRHWVWGATSSPGVDYSYLALPDR